MDLDEAIKHAEDVASSCDGQCSLDHKQLAEWLKELRYLRSLKSRENRNEKDD